MNALVRLTDRRKPAAIVVLVFVLGTLSGCGNDLDTSGGSGANEGLASSPVEASEPTVSDSPSPEPTEAPTPEPTAEPTPPPGVVLVTMTGTGAKTSGSFATSGTSVGIEVEWDCAAFGPGANLYATLSQGDTFKSIPMQYVLVGETGTGSETVPLEPGGDYTFEINSQCSWTFKVTGQP